MCTSIALTTGSFYFGRNLDLECQFGERVVITPRNYPFQFRRAGEMTGHYAMIGMAAVADGYPLYAEAGNEKGLCMAGLNFPGYAYYPEAEKADQANVAPFELIPWVLGQCASVDEAEALLSETHLSGISFSENMPITPLHWHIADRNRSVVLEAVRDGMHIYDNPVGVMTNSPAFDFHMTNLRQYMNLTAAYPDNRFSDRIELKPFGVGMGGIGLPGDCSPISRFVRAAFLKLNSVSGTDEESSTARFFHLLDAVAMPDGIVATESGRYEFTVYSSCISADKGIFYYKTYENNQLTAVDMRRENLDGAELTEYPLERRQRIAWMN